MKRLPSSIRSVFATAAALSILSISVAAPALSLDAPLQIAPMESLPAAARALRPGAVSAGAGVTTAGSAGSAAYLHFYTVASRLSGDRDGMLDIFARPLGARRSGGARRAASEPRLKRLHRIEMGSWMVDSKGQLDREIVHLYWLQPRLRRGLVLQLHTTLHIFPQGFGGRMVTQELPTTSSHDEPMFCFYDGVDSRGYGRVRVEAGASASDFNLFWNGSAFVPRKDDKAAWNALPDYERAKLK